MREGEREGGEGWFFFFFSSFVFVLCVYAWSERERRSEIRRASSFNKLV